MLTDRTVVSLSGVNLAYSPDEHPFHAANRAAIRGNWQAELSRRPALFDGQVMLARDVAIDDGVLSANCHLVPFSTLMFWRLTRPFADAVHIFAMAVPVGSDGGVIVTEMSPGTANAGLVYCPAGSFDTSDLSDGRFDPDANMMREVAEETGLDLASAEAEPAFNAVLVDGALTLFRAYRFCRRADALVEAVRLHIASEQDPELADAFAVHGRADITPQFAGHMPVILDHYMGA